MESNITVNKSKEVRKEIDNQIRRTLAKTLAKNLSAALKVAGQLPPGDGNSVKKMKLTEFHAKSNIALSTLYKLVNDNADSQIEANPDLETICRIAAALNLPPAFLLMTGDDWQILLASLNALPAAAADSDFRTSLKNFKGNEKINLGIDFVNKLYSENFGLLTKPEEESEQQTEIDKEIINQNQMKRLAILTTTAIAQNSAKYPNDLVPLTAIGAFFGANYKPFNQEI